MAAAGESKQLRHTFPMEVWLQNLSDRQLDLPSGLPSGLPSAPPMVRMCVEAFQEGLSVPPLSRPC